MNKSTIQSYLRPEPALHGGKWLSNLDTTGFVGKDTEGGLIEARDSLVTGCGDG